MKKIIFILILVLTMASSVTAGTLAMYTASIDSLAEGSIVAKEFVFVGDGTDSFKQGIKIAPSETVRWQFKVKNYENHVTTETDLYYKLTFNMSASAGKNAIKPLTVSVMDTNGKILNSAAGTGTFDVTGAFPLSETGQEKDYVVEIRWPGNDGSDIDYAGENYGTDIRVDAVASQVPFGGGSDTGDPQKKDISVKYETTVPWQNGQSGIYEYEYKVTITNNTDQVIKDWDIAFSLSTDRLISAWSNAKLVTGLPDGFYKFVNPGYNNQATDNILPGQSVTFRGPARGMGTEPIRNVSIGGSNINTNSNVDLICKFGNTSLS